MVNHSHLSTFTLFFWHQTQPNHLTTLGYKFSGTDQTLGLLQYTDDTCLVTNGPSSCKEMLRLTEKWLKWSGMKPTVRKCHQEQVSNYPALSSRAEFTSSWFSLLSNGGTLNCDNVEARPMGPPALGCWVRERERERERERGRERNRAVWTDG